MYIYFWGYARVFRCERMGWLWLWIQREFVSVCCVCMQLNVYIKLHNQLNWIIQFCMHVFACACSCDFILCVSAVAFFFFNFVCSLSAQQCVIPPLNYKYISHMLFHTFGPCWLNAQIHSYKRKKGFHELWPDNIVTYARTYSIAIIHKAGTWSGWNGNR